MMTKSTLSVALIIALCAIQGPSLVFAQCEPTEVQKLLADDGEAGDTFGRALALDGDWVVIGASLDDDLGSNAGAAYFFQLQGNAWQEVAKVHADDGVVDDRFGRHVALCGEWAALVAENDDTDEGGSGSVYIFRGVREMWDQYAKLTSPDPSPEEAFGRSVAFDGTVLVISDLFDDEATGAVYVYRFDGAVWVYEAKLTASDGLPGDCFGNSVDVLGNRIVVGMHFGPTLPGTVGGFYIFERTDFKWFEVAKLVGSDSDPGDAFGNGVELAVGLLAVSAEFDEKERGSVYVFREEAGDWFEEAKLVGSDSAADDQFGAGTAIGTDIILISGSLNDVAGTDSGAAYLFRHNGTQWVENAKLQPTDITRGDRFGVGVTLDGETAIIGARFDDDLRTDAGSAYVFDLGCKDEGPVDGDANGDGAVDPLDAGFVQARFGCPVGRGDPQCDAADQNGDGAVDPLDYGYVLARFGNED